MLGLPAAVLFATAAPLPEGAPLVWSAPAGCPDHDELVERIEGYAATTAGATSVRAVGEITAEVGEHHLVLRVRTASGSSGLDLRHADCDALADAAAVKIALAMDSVGERVPPTSGLATPTVVSPAVPAVVTVVRPPAPPPSRRVVGLHAAAGLDWGTVPGVGPVLEIGVALTRFERLRVEAFGQYTSTREFWARDAPQFGGAIRATMGGLCVGPVWLFASFELSICGSLEAGSVFARGLADARSVTQRVFRMAVGARPSLAWQPHPRIGARLDLGTAVPLRRVAFEAAPGVVYRAKPLSLRALLGFHVRF